jgi:hypothetical protein
VIPVRLLLALIVVVCAAAPAHAQEAETEKKSPFTAEVSLTQFVQGPVSGGIGSDLEYGGRFDVEATLDPARLGLWSHGLLSAKVITRYEDSAAGELGSAASVNAALLTPADSGTVAALLALNYTHMLPLDDPGDMVALAVGKFDGFDLVTEAFIGGGGITKWMNLAQAIPPHEARNIPTLTPLGGTIALVLGGEMRAALAVLDPGSPSTTSGLGDLFDEGVTLIPSVIFPTRFFGKAGHHELRLTWSSRETIPFAQIPYILLPRPIRELDRVDNSWTFTLLGDQYLSENPGPPRTGWGLFWTLGVGDPDSNAIPLFINFGFGGSSPFSSRPLDSAGLAFGYLGLSDDLEDVLDPLVSIRDEWEAELYYALALESWCVLTADLQLVRPFRSNVDATLVPGARLQLVF